MIGLDMEMPKGCWHCKMKYGHYETRCFFTHRCIDDSWYSKRRSSDCPLIEIKEEDRKGGTE